LDILLEGKRENSSGIPAQRWGELLFRAGKEQIGTNEDTFVSRAKFKNLS